MNLALLNFWCVHFLSYYSQGKTLWLDSWLHHCLRCHLGLIYSCHFLTSICTSASGHWVSLGTLTDSQKHNCQGCRHQSREGISCLLVPQTYTLQSSNSESPSQMQPTSTVWKPQIAAKKLQLEGRVVRSTWNIFLGVNSDIWHVDSIDPGKNRDCYFQFTNIWVLCQGKETVKSQPLSSLHP